MSNRRPSLFRTASRLLEDLLALVRLGLTSQTHLAAENVFPRKQLASIRSDVPRRRRPDPRDARGACRVVPMAGLARDAHGGPARHVDSVAPPGLATVLAVESRAGRPPIPSDLGRLIIAMARANPTWG